MKDALDRRYHAGPARHMIRSAVRFLHVGLVIIAAALLAGCGGSSPSRNVDSQLDASAERWFGEIADSAGLDLVHSNGMTGQYYPPEIMGPGIALLDFDNDGDLDVLALQDAPIDALKAAGPTSRSTPHLFLNDLIVRGDGTRTVRFTDVTASSGLTAAAYPVGLATGDFDNDGCIDVYLTEVGRNQLFRNNCDGTFADVTMRSGTASPGWSVSASFVDYDRDGWLDLFVSHYLKFDVAHNKICHSWAGTLDYCAPSAYPAEQSRLYHNNRDGTFTDVTQNALRGVIEDASGTRADYGPALGVVAADFNRDGWLDLFVANDGQLNQLWLNQHDGTFIDAALTSGVALRSTGRTTASMGVSAGDFDNDGDEDLLVTNLTGEGDSLFVNDGSARFEDRSSLTQLGVASLKYTGFGAGWLDVDNDGWLDAFAANGAVRTLEGEARANEPFPFHQRRQLLRNSGDGQFADVTDRGGPAFASSEVGRGVAFGDVDNDGRMDIVVSNDNGPLRLFVNQIRNGHHWMGLRLVGGRGPRDLLGASVEIARPGVPTLFRRARTDGSYASASDPRVLVGLGSLNVRPDVRVTWPDGSQERWPSLPYDQYVTLKQGTAR